MNKSIDESKCLSCYSQERTAQNIFRSHWTDGLQGKHKSNDTISVTCSIILSRPNHINKIEADASISRAGKTGSSELLRDPRGNSLVFLDNVFGKFTDLLQ